MFLTAQFGAELNPEYRLARPIPSGAISAKTVWRTGLGLLGAGAICLIFLGQTTGILAVLLVLCILIYDAVHKLITVSPVLMAGCRFLLYLVAASTAVDGVTGWSVWCAFALAAYIIGLSYLARNDSTLLSVRLRPCLFLASPILPP